MTSEAFAAGGYRYIPGVFQYSAGVAAADGYMIERAMFRRPVPLRAGFDRIRAHLTAAGRPPAAFCACELRSPAPMSEPEFRAFNELYVGVLRDWGIVTDGGNPVARSNVCPEIAPPPEPSFHAFSYTVPAGGSAPSFVIAGSGEVPEGKDNYRDHIVRPGDTSAAGLRAKADYVLAEMERRMAAFGHGWTETTAVQAYTVHDLHPFLADALVARGAAAHGLTWQFCRPPVAGLDYEMDCRGVGVERVV
ncbi:MAG: hypothetical protein KDK07_18175 [Bauldia sp.]|nr:hypothetical protein [Bauldia sp.]